MRDDSPKRTFLRRSILFTTTKPAAEQRTTVISDTFTSIVKQLET